MSRIGDLLTRTVAPKVTSEVQRNLRGLFGGIVRGYLPQVWWFTTESGSATLFVNEQGLCQVHDGQSGAPDGSIAWTDGAFQIALTAQDRSGLPVGTQAPQIQTYSKKGQTAFGFLRKRFGV